MKNPNIKNLVISLPKDPRRPYIKKQFEKIKQSFEFIDAVSGKELMESGVFSQCHTNFNLPTVAQSWNRFALHMSTIKALQYAKNKKYDYFTVYEDDCLFLKDFNDNLDYLIKELPDNWDVVNLGPRQSPSIVKIKNKKFLCEINDQITGTQSLLFNLKNVDRVLTVLLNWNSIVMFFSPCIRLNKFAVSPSFTTQEGSLRSVMRHD